MHKNRLHVFILIALIDWGCSSNNHKKQAVISGNFSIADSSDQAGNFLPVSIAIIREDSVKTDPDTLFQADTDTSGTFSGKASFPKKRQYTAFISRNGQHLVRFAVILAENDSIQINGSFPDIEQTLTVSSHEHDAMQQLRNLNQGFQRIVRFANAGKLSGDTLQQELSKWSDLYMDLYDQNKDTKAGKLAVSESVRLLQGWNNPEMMNRIRQVQEKDVFASLAADYGKEYIAQSQGLEAALAYLDTLSGITKAHDQRMRIGMKRIELLYDSARVQEARKFLDAFQKEYSGDSTGQQWVESISYDLHYLSPGDGVPEFEFTQKGRTVSRDSLLGNPYILEVTRLANPLYQEQFDRTVVIHSIYKNYGLNVVTLPLDESQITVDAFFEERIKPWPVADARAFDREDLLENFNIRLVPTRFLIDEKGNIVRKYVGREFKDVIKDLQTVTSKAKQ